MENNRKKALRGITCAAVLCMAAVLLSCGESAGKPSGTEENTQEKGSETETPVTEQTEEVSPLYKQLEEDLDFGGKDIRFIGCGNFYPAMFAEEDSGDIVESAVYKRNSLVNEWLNVNITVGEKLKKETTISFVNTEVMSGNAAYDVVIADEYCITMAAHGYLRNLTDAPYFDFSQKWWKQNIIDEVAYKGTYFLYGFLSTTDVNSQCMLVNRRIWSDLDLGDIYQTVREGKWTLDELENVCKDAYVDLNSNNQIDFGDQFGLLYWDAGNFMLGFGAMTTSRDSDGKPYLDMISDRNATMFSHLCDVLHNQTLAQYFDVHHMENYDKMERWEVFATGRSLIYAHDFNSIAKSSVREMKDDYYIIPFPKYDENQEEYITIDGGNPYGVLTSTDRYEAVCATLEGMAIEGERMLIPVYYETALKEKYARDPETAEMLEIIRSNMRYNFGWAYSQPIGSGVDNLYNAIGRIYMFADEDGADTISTRYEQNRNSYEYNLKLLLQMLEQAD